MSAQRHSAVSYVDIVSTRGSFIARTERIRGETAARPLGEVKKSCPTARRNSCTASVYMRRGAARYRVDDGRTPSRPAAVIRRAGEPLSLAAEASENMMSPRPGSGTNLTRGAGTGRLALGRVYILACYGAALPIPPAGAR